MKNKNKNTKKNKERMNNYQLHIIHQLLSYYKEITEYPFPYSKKGFEKVNEEIQLKLSGMEKLPSCSCCDDKVYPFDMMFDKFQSIYERFNNNSLTKRDTEFLNQDSIELFSRVSMFK